MIKPGMRVRFERERPAAGTWHLYAGKKGVVIYVNRAAGEYGCTVDGRDTVARLPGGKLDPTRGYASICWFTADELTVLTDELGVRVPEKAASA